MQGPPRHHGAHLRDPAKVGLPRVVSGVQNHAYREVGQVAHHQNEPRAHHDAVLLHGLRQREQSCADDGVDEVEDGGLQGGLAVRHVVACIHHRRQTDCAATLVIVVVRPVGRAAAVPGVDAAGLAGLTTRQGVNQRLRQVLLLLHGKKPPVCGAGDGGTEKAACVSRRDPHPPDGACAGARGRGSSPQLQPPNPFSRKSWLDASGCRGREEARV
jgi:hypothetical protein